MLYDTITEVLEEADQVDRVQLKDVIVIKEVDAAIGVGRGPSGPSR